MGGKMAKIGGLDCRLRSRRVVKYCREVIIIK